MPKHTFTKETAAAAGRKSGQARREGSLANPTPTMAAIGELMRDMVDRRQMAQTLIYNMGKSPEWFKLGLRLLGELPPEQVEVSKPKAEMAEEIAAALRERMSELGGAPSERSGAANERSGATNGATNRAASELNAK